ncbi:MAG: YDG domain-containing protein, partial [Gammaproteobacteria bacterium]
ANLGGAFAADDIINGDSVTIDSAAAVYANANAGAGIDIKGFTLGGTDGDNYHLASASSISGEITNRPLRVTASGSTSGDTAPSASQLADHSLLLIGAAADEGLANSDTAEQVFTGTLAIGHRVGSTAPLTQGSLLLKTTPPGGNYTLDFTPGAFTFGALQQLVITPRAARKVYGQEDPAIAYDATFDANDDAAKVFSTSPLERIAGENAGEYAYQPKNPVPFKPGFDAKYEFVFAGTNAFTIDRKPLRYTSTKADKIYDGNAIRPSVLGGSFTAGDVVKTTINGIDIDDAAPGRLRIDGGAYVGKNAGAGKAVTGATLAGGAAANYTLSADIRGEITPRLITVTAVTLTKQYDSTDSAAGAAIKGGAVTGAVGDEAFTLQVTIGNDVTYADTDTGGGIAVNNVNMEDFTLVGGDAASIPANYALPANLRVTGVITPKPLGIAEVTLTKVYDSSNAITGAALSGGAISGATSSQHFTLQVAEGSDGEYASADAGAGIGIDNMTAADFALVGGNAASKPQNYMLPADIAVVGNITRRPLRVSAEGASLSGLFDINLSGQFGVPNEGLVAPHQLRDVLIGAVLPGVRMTSLSTAPILIGTLATSDGLPGSNYALFFLGGNIVFDEASCSFWGTASDCSDNRVMRIPNARVIESAAAAARVITVAITEGMSPFRPQVSFPDEPILRDPSDTTRLAAPADLGLEKFVVAPSLFLDAVAATDTQFMFTLPLVDDQLVEGDETFTVLISGSAGTVPARRQITIVDDETATIAFGGNAASRNTYARTAAESQARLTLPVTVSHLPDEETTFTVVVRGSAAEPADYAIASRNITFTPDSAMTQNLEITLADDTLFEPDEHIRLSFADSAADSLGRHYARSNTADITLTSEDSMLMLTLTPASLEATEGEAARFTLQLSRASPRTVRAVYSLTAGSATANADYAADGGVVTFAPGETTATISIPVFTDGISEDNEDFTLRIAPAPGETGVAAGIPASATITIIDIDISG